MYSTQEQTAHKNKQSTYKKHAVTQSHHLTDLIRLPCVIPDKILLFLLCLLSTTIISKTVAFNRAFQSGLDPFIFFLIFKFKFKFIDFEKTKFKFKFIDFEKTKFKFKFKFIDFAKVEFKFKFINNS